MKAESEQRPENKFDINIRDNDLAIVIFFDNIQKIKEEEKTKFTYDTYELIIQNRENLEKEIKLNFEKFLNSAIDYEKNKSEKSKDERAWRNSKIEETDKWLLEDFPIQYPKESILKFREALRDYPSTPGFPYDCVRPKIEDFI